MEAEKRALRIIVDDNTDRNPIPEKARIWVRGYGDLWAQRFHNGLFRDVSLGTHSGDICIHPGYEQREHPGHAFDYVMRPVEHMINSTAYFAVGTIYIEFFDDRIFVHGVPIGDELTFYRSDDMPQREMDFAELEKRVAALEQKSHPNHWDTSRTGGR